MDEFATKLPAILTFPGTKFSSISMERALKQIRELLIQVPIEEEETEDRINASLDDLDLMIKAIK